MNFSNYTGDFYNDAHATELGNPCPNLRAISRPLLFVHNYSLLFFGSICNILAFFILMQGSLRCHSTFAYLAFLSLSNGLLSLVRFAQWTFTYYLHIQFENYLFSCRFHHFILDFLTHFSLFTLVCVNIDRARTVTRSRPNTKFARSTFHTVLIKESMIAAVLCAYHFHWLVKFGHQGRSFSAPDRDDDDHSSGLHPREISPLTSSHPVPVMKRECLIFHSDSALMRCSTAASHSTGRFLTLHDPFNLGRLMILHLLQTCRRAQVYTRSNSFTIVPTKATVQLKEQDLPSKPYTAVRENCCGERTSPFYCSVRWTRQIHGLQRRSQQELNRLLLLSRQTLSIV